MENNKNSSEQIFLILLSDYISMLRSKFSFKECELKMEFNILFRCFFLLTSCMYVSVVNAQSVEQLRGNTYTLETDESYEDTEIPYCHYVKGSSIKRTLKFSDSAYDTSAVISVYSSKRTEYTAGVLFHNKSKAQDCRDLRSVGSITHAITFGKGEFESVIKDSFNRDVIGDTSRGKYQISNGGYTLTLYYDDGTKRVYTATNIVLKESEADRAAKAYNNNTERNIGNPEVSLSCQLLDQDYKRELAIYLWPSKKLCASTVAAVGYKCTVTPAEYYWSEGFGKDDFGVYTLSRATGTLSYRSTRYQCSEVKPRF